MGDIRKHHPPSVNSRSDLLPEMITFYEGGMWSRRTRMEKILILFLVLVLLVLVFLVSLYFAFVFFKTIPSEDVCQTADCLKAASVLSESLDPETDPCDDFYQFACGRWLESHTIPSDKSAVESVGTLVDVVNEVLKEALVEKDDNDPRDVQRARAYFRCCEDTDQIEKRGVKPLLDLFKATGKVIFPTLNPSWAEKNLRFNEIAELSASVGGLGSIGLFTFGVESTPFNSSKKIIVVSQVDLTLPDRDMYLGNRGSLILTKYESVYTQILTLLGADRTTATQDAKDVVDFEIQLANISETKADLTNTQNITVLGNLTKLYPEFQWLEYFQKLFRRFNVSITENEPVWTVGRSYYDKVFPLLKKTPTRTVLNYCMWAITFYLTPFMHQEFSNVKSQFEQSLELSGTKRQTERWMTCLKNTVSMFPDAAGRLYVERVFPEQHKIKMQSLVDNIRTALHEMILELDWMTLKTKQAAIDKLSMVKYKIGYPDYLLNDTRLDSRAQPYVSEGLFFETTLNILSRSFLDKLSTLRSPPDSEEWQLSAADPNGYYLDTKNEIGFPAALLQPPFFHPQMPDSINYGSIGAVIGHELTHGFDNKGSTFDKYGNIQQWWQAEDWARFTNKTNCFVEQYNNFTVEKLGMKVKGLQTLGENIADSGGLKEAYRAYRTSISKRRTEEAKLPVLHYSHDQLFFIGYAQLWCSNFRDELMEQVLRTDEHSPPRFRVLGPLQNNEDFARVFSCQEGSPMNPEKKCHLW